MTANTLPKSAAEARAIGAQRYFTGAPCKHGHIAERHVKGTCVECTRLRGRQLYAENPGYWKAHREKNKAVYAAAQMRFRDKDRERARQADREFKKQHPGKVRHDAGLRRARLLNAAPAWVNPQELRTVYEACPAGLEVDHIIPLVAETVCGLHVPWNLQYLTRAENRRKGRAVAILGEQPWA